MGFVNFSYKDCSELLNDIFAYNAERDGSVTLAPDLSNIVDFGRSVTGSMDITTTGDALVNKIRRQVLLRTDFIHTGPDCFYNNEDWAGITEVYRVSIGNYSKSHIFDAVQPNTTASPNTYYSNVNTFDDLFGKELPTLHAKYFDSAFTYRKKITIAPYQFANAFLSAENMSQFINEISRKVSEQWEFAKEQLEYLALASVVKIATDRIVLADGETTYGASDANIVSSKSLILKTWTTPAELYCKVKKILRDMQCYNNKYSDDDYVSSVSAENLVCYMRADLYDMLIANIENFTYNGDEVKSILGTFKPLPYFGYASDTGAIVTKENSNVKCLRNIDYIICDKRLFGCTASHNKVTSQYVANEDVTNYFHNAMLKIRVNTELPLVVECDCNYIVDATDSTKLDSFSDAVSGKADPEI